MGRDAFKAPCRFLRDNDQVSTIEWYEAADDAVNLDMPSAIVNPWIEIQDFYEPPVGIIPQLHYQFTQRLAPPGANGGHVCGTAEDFAEGGHYDDTLPPVRYSSTGLPLCCNPARIGRGGVGFGGRADVSYTHQVDALEGGVEFGGTVGDDLAYVDALSGGVEFGGTVGW
jgi:hypothetical protein